MLFLCKSEALVSFPAMLLYGIPDVQVSHSTSVLAFHPSLLSGGRAVDASLKKR